MFRLSLVLRTCVAVSSTLVFVTARPSPARAAVAESGTLSGIVRHPTTRAPVENALVVLQCSCLQAPLETQTNDNGLYAFQGLPPGTYTVQVLAGRADVSKVSTLERGITARVDFEVNPASEERRVVRVRTRPIEQNTTAGRSIEMEPYQNVPVGQTTSRDFTEVVESSATASRDSAGISLGGTTAAETRYTVDGVNVSHPAFGTVGALIVQDFLEHVEVDEAGYDAEHGFAAGGQVRAQRITGTNVVRGKARFTYMPRLAPGRFVFSNDNAIRAVEIPDFGMEAVVQADGPFVKDKLFWAGGISLAGTRNSLVQSFHARVDRDGSGGFEPCPFRNGDNDCAEGRSFIETRKFAEQTFKTGGVRLGYFFGLDWVVKPKHRLSASVIGGPTFTRRTYRRPITPELATEPGTFGTVPNADPLGGSLRTADGIVNDHFGWDRGNFTTTTLSYLGRVADDKLEIDAGLGFSQFVRQEAWKLDNPEYYDLPATITRNVHGANLYALLDRDGRRDLVGGVDEACNDTDVPGLACPTRSWMSGGIGGYGKDISRRTEARLGLTHFFDLFGSHQLKYGAQVEHASRRTIARFSGQNAGDFGDNCGGLEGGGEWCYDGAADEYLFPPGPRVDNHRLIFVDSSNPNARTTYGYGRVREEQGGLRAIATPIGAGVRVAAHDSTLTAQNYAVYLQDKWAIRSNLFVTAGVRWEIQDMRDIFGDRAILLWDNVAPRLGFVYDWTKEGRSRLYGSYGWFYQPLPLQLGNRVFGGLVEVRRTYDAVQCGSQVVIDGQPHAQEVDGQPTEWCTDSRYRTSGLLEGAVVPELKGAYNQQWQVGYEHEVIDDLTLGVRWLHTHQARAVEDVSTNGGETFIIANPGTPVDERDIAARQRQCEALAAELAALPPDSPQAAQVARERQRCEFLVDAYQEVGTAFRKPRRSFDAFTFEAKKRFSKQWLLIGSYTYSRLVGNYDGFVDPVTGGINLGASTQYNLPELVRNSYGPLSFDTPHRVKLDGFYTVDFGQAGALTLGTSFRFQSGFPISMRVGHQRYTETYPVYLLPRGAGGRVDPNYLLNLSASYAYPLPRNVVLEVAARLINVTNAAATLRVDEVYSFENARPIAGGTLEDLEHAKVINTANPSDFYDRRIVTRQGNYGARASVQIPMSGAFELRLRF